MLGSKISNRNSYECLIYNSYDIYTIQFKKKIPALKSQVWKIYDTWQIPKIIYTWWALQNKLVTTIISPLNYLVSFWTLDRILLLKHTISSPSWVAGCRATWFVGIVIVSLHRLVSRIIIMITSNNRIARHCWHQLWTEILWKKRGKH